MRIATLLLVGALAAPLLGCVSIKAGNGPGAALVRMDGPVNAHVAAGPPLRTRSVVDVGVGTNTARSREIVSVDVWPLFGVGVGVVGARASVLGFEVGVGGLGYDPDPSSVPAESDADDDADPPAQPDIAQDGPTSP